VSNKQTRKPSPSPSTAGAEAAIADGRRVRGEKARAVILKRAIEMASVRGLEGLTIGELAGELAISKGNITALFRDKEELQIKTLDAAVDIFVAHVVRPALADSSPLRRLALLSDRWFDYVEQRVFPGGCMLHAATNEYRTRPGAIQDCVNRHRKAWSRLLARTAAEAVAALEMAANTDVEQLVFELTAFQSAANAAALLGDQPAFVRARRTSAARIAALARPRREPAAAPVSKRKTANT
jgi:AcrR family transcriptional regulator